MIDASDFTVVTWTLVAIVLALIVLPLVFDKDPDIPPMALEFQSAISQTRKPTESAIYRSLETPHGFPLRSGLGIKQGYSVRDGDVRDIWNLFMQNDGKLVTILGLQKVIHAVDQLDKEIDILGEYIQRLDTGTKNPVVAVYLPNSAENLTATFACAYYGFTLALLPYPAEPHVLKAHISLLRPHVLIHAAGTVDLDDVPDVHTLRHTITVVEEGSRHMDFTMDTEFGYTSICWHDLADSDKRGTRPENLDMSVPAMTFVVRTVSMDKLVSYTHRNIIAAVAAQMTATPIKERLKPEDTFLPINTLADQFCRIITYAAMASGCIIALNSVAGPDKDVEVCARVAEPSVIVTSPDALFNTHRIAMASHVEFYHEIVHYFQKKTLRSGRLPKGNFMTRFNDYTRPRVKNLRLIYVAENSLANTKALSSAALNNLRAIFQSRIIYALTYSPDVAGAITQQHPYDYRVEEDSGPVPLAHFGSPLACLEIKTRDFMTMKADDKEGPTGEICVKGPAVVDGERIVPIIGRWRKDGCLSLVVQQ